MEEEKKVPESVEPEMEKKEDFLDEKKFHLGKLIFNIIFWLTISVLLFTWIMDYINVRNNKKPSFCLKNITHKFDDGNVTECVGLGYKVFNYDRASMTKGSEFVPFFINMKESSK